MQTAALGAKVELDLYLSCVAFLQALDAATQCELGDQQFVVWGTARNFKTNQGPDISEKNRGKLSANTNNRITTSDSQKQNRF